GEIKYRTSASLGGGGGSYTFSNGLDESGGYVTLGGTLGVNTIIDGDTYSLEISYGTLATTDSASWKLAPTQFDMFLQEYTDASNYRNTSIAFNYDGYTIQNNDR